MNRDGTLDIDLREAAREVAQLAVEAPASATASDAVGAGGTATTTSTLTAAPPASPKPEVQKAPRPAAPRKGRSTSRSARRRRSRRIVAGLMTLLVAGGACLALVGYSKVRGSTIGRYVDPTLKPEDPGFAAYVTPTPTLLVASRAPDGTLSGLALLSLQPGDQGGSVIVMPVGVTGQFGTTPLTFGEAYTNLGVDGLENWVETVLRIGIDDTVEIDDARWANLLGPVGPLTMDVDEMVAQWPTGPATVQPQEVGAFLAAREAGQSELLRTDRQATFWQSWLQRIAQVGTSAVPGEVNTGLGRFVRRIAAAPDDIASLPVAPVSGAAVESFEMNGLLAGDMLAQAVPYPTSPAPGVRPRVRVLNGTTDPDLNVQAARGLVAGGAEIAISGNADSFGVQTTKIIYSTREMKEVAMLLQAFLGIGVVEADPNDEDVTASDDDSNRIDITVILGADAPEALKARR